MEAKPERNHDILQKFGSASFKLRQKKGYIHVVLVESIAKLQKRVTEVFFLCE